MCGNPKLKSTWVHFDSDISLTPGDLESYPSLVFESVKYG